MKFIQDLCRTFFAWVADTFHEIHNWFLCTDLGRWWRNLPAWNRFWADRCFWLLLGISLMFFGAS